MQHLFATSIYYALNQFEPFNISPEHLNDMNIQFLQDVPTSTLASKGQKTVSEDSMSRSTYESARGYITYRVHKYIVV